MTGYIVLEVDSASADVGGATIVVDAADVVVVQKDCKRESAHVVTPGVTLGEVIREGPRGRKGDRGDPGDSVSLTAGATVLAYRVVMLHHAGAVVHADAGTESHAEKVIGVSLNAALAGDPVGIAYEGVVENMGWSFTAGDHLFLGLDGEITTSHHAGVFMLSIGCAVSPTQIFLRIGAPIMRT